MVRQNIPSQKQTGFTLLELVIVIVIISILGFFAIDRIFAIRAAAEQSSVKQLVGTIKSALGLEVARLALAGNLNGVAQLDKTNPLNLLSQKPNNYIGEKKDISKVTRTGVWYFDKNQKALVYNVNYEESFKTKLEGLPRIRYRVKLVYNDQNKNKKYDRRSDSIGGLDFLPVEKFSWNVKKEI